MQKTERLVSIALLLQARGKLTAKRLAELLGVSTRTIYRDITTLSLAHVPVSMDYGPGGGYYLPDDYRLETAIFTKEEAVSLVIGGAMVGNQGLFADNEDLHRALLKLEAALPEEYRADVRVARERILFDTSAWYDRSPMASYLDSIRTALWKTLQLDIRYPCGSPARPQWLSVDPYGLVYKGLSRRQIRTGIWYLIAFCRRCQRFCAFRVSHIEEVRVGDQFANIHRDFDLQSFWQQAGGEIVELTHPFVLKLRVSPAGRTSLHGDYSILHEEPGGGAIVRVNLESFDAAVAYTLALGADATVLQPERVREAVIATAQTITEMYDAWIREGASELR